MLADAALHLITWDKGYQAQAWPPPGGITGAMALERRGTWAEAIRSDRLEYSDRRWPKDQRLRQLVVQATNPRNRSIQSHFTDDQATARSRSSADV